MLITLIAAGVDGDVRVAGTDSLAHEVGAFDKPKMSGVRNAFSLLLHRRQIHSDLLAKQ